MAAYIKQIWRTPTFADEEQARIAHLLNIILFSVFGGTAIYTLLIPLITFNYFERLCFAGTIFAIILATRLCINWGYVRLASMALVTGMWLILTLSALQRGGVNSPSFDSYTVFILIAGFLIEGWVGIGLACLSILTGLGMLWANINPSLSVDSPFAASFIHWLVGSLSFGIVAILQYLATTNIRQALTLAQEKERDLAASAIELKRSETRYRALAEAIPEAILRIHRDGTVIDVKPPTNFVLFKSAAELIGHKIQDVLPPQMMPLFDENSRQITQEQNVLGYEFDIQLGETTHTHESRLVEGENEVVVFIRNISHRKRAEEALRQSEERYRKLVESSPDAILIHRNQTIIYANPACLRLVGASESQQLINTCLFDIIHPDYHPMVQERLDRLYAGQEIALDEQKIVRLDGTTVTVEVAAVAFRDQDENDVQVIYRDVSERKQAEAHNAQLLYEVNQQRSQLRALNTRFAKAEENERKRLAQELHDSVAQNLTGVNLNLNVIRAQLGREVAADSRLHVRLKDAIILVEQTTVQIRDMMASLRPPVLDDYGLLATLEWYASQISLRTGLAIDVLGEELKPRPTEYVELTLFRIVQEALNNVVRHALATKSTIVLAAKAETIYLSIIDNGLGLDLGMLDHADKRQQWGFIIMRERAEAAGGWCQIESNSGLGTTVQVEVPR